MCEVGLKSFEPKDAEICGHPSIDLEPVLDPSGQPPVIGSTRGKGGKVAGQCELLGIFVRKSPDAEMAAAEEMKS